MSQGTLPATTAGLYQPLCREDRHDDRTYPGRQGHCRGTKTDSLATVTEGSCETTANAQSKPAINSTALAQPITGPDSRVTSHVDQTETHTTIRSESGSSKPHSGTKPGQDAGFASRSIRTPSASDTADQLPPSILSCRDWRVREEREREERESRFHLPLHCKRNSLPLTRNHSQTFPTFFSRQQGQT